MSKNKLEVRKWKIFQDIYCEGKDRDRAISTGTGGGGGLWVLLLF